MKSQHRIRNQVIGQYRSEQKMAWESPDEQDRFMFGASVPRTETQKVRRGLGRMEACAGCERTKDLWSANTGQGLSKGGRRYCCKPCASGEPCECSVSI